MQKYYDNSSDASSEQSEEEQRPPSPIRGIKFVEIRNPFDYQSKEISIDVDYLPTAQDHIENHYSCLRFYYKKYQRYVPITIFLIAAIIFTIVIAIQASSSVVTLPCTKYGKGTLAKDVSIECLRYIWNMYACENPAVFPPDNYQGWWNRSPLGEVAVNCNLDANCGVGSYYNIITYMKKCKAYYRGEGM
jgi:hypothetical protein